MLGVDDGVELAQELDGLEVLPAAELVGHPLPFLAGVVEVEHRRHRVDPQAVDVQLLDPVQGVGQQEVADLVAPEVEDQRAPVGVLALAGVGVLVEGGAVEAGQGEVVLGEVGRHPVDDDADAGLVQGVDEEPEVVGRAEAGGGRVVGGDLVAPRPAEGVLGHGQELDVGEAHLGEVGRQLLGQLPVGQRPVALLGHVPPRAEVALVDRHRAGPRVGRRAGAASHSASPQS